MLRSLEELKGYTIQATDGEIGRCHDFLFDDQTWAVRYMVADTRKWLPGKKVVISPIALGDPDWTARRLPVKLTQEQVRSAPDLDEHAPVTRQYEIWYHKHYDWPFYWSGAGLWASGIHPQPLYSAGLAPDAEVADLERPHLHAVGDIQGYDIGATDGEIGHVTDFIVDDETWVVRYAVVATRDWLPGKVVLVPLSALKSVDWIGRELQVDLTRQRIKDSPAYDPTTPINREYEERLYDFVGRPTDWS